jgi:hypothetical protein
MKQFILILNNNNNIHTYYEVRDNNKSLFNFIKCDSKIEYKYNENLHNKQEVEPFLKLPNWFVTNTPLVSYNPDWTFSTLDKQLLYKLNKNNRIWVVVQLCALGYTQNILWILIGL